MQQSCIFNFYSLINVPPYRPIGMKCISAPHPGFSMQCEPLLTPPSS